MKADLPKREPQILRFWEENKIYEQVRNWRSGKPKFILHDGPPYANGDIHIGTALNKVLKDIVIKFAVMDGYDAPYVPGWDTHGLPIELQAIKAAGVDRHALSPMELRRQCKEYALKYVSVQREQFKRLGVTGDWEHPYLTLEPKFEAEQIRVFGQMAKRGYIYKGLKPVYWCTSCETALAEAEVEYEDRKSPSIYVAFPVIDGKGVLPANSHVVIWTTTPWTIPANTGIALHPEARYVLVDGGHKKLLVGESRAKEVAELVGIHHATVAGTFVGRELEGIKCKHPLFDRESLLITADYVSLEEGTGCVHIAPGHGLEDYESGIKFGLPVINPVNERGYFTAEAGDFQGMFYAKANDAILKSLVDKGLLIHKTEIVHQYPHCWRCKEPVIFRATEQWFASVEGFRRQALDAIKSVKWIPPWGEERITNMVEGRSDWCISRQRAWGVPIPVFYCAACGKPVFTEESLEAVARLFEQRGSDAWFELDANEILPRDFCCPDCSGTEFIKERDIMDVWFDSGSSHAAVLTQERGLQWPSDMYLEGSDQHRGWFQSSLLTAVATRGQAPYRSVLTHGFVVDGEGRKMSKSLGNVISPLEVIEEYGADILRLWVASADYRGDIRVSREILAQLAEVYRKIRNTFRYLLGNLYDYDPSRDEVPYDQLLELDKWALHQLQKLVSRVTRAYREYEYHVIFHAINQFCTVDMSAFYLDVLKDRLYTEVYNSVKRRSAQTVLHNVALTLVKLVAPILAFTSEEVWQHLRKPGDPVSVQLLDWPQVKEEFLDYELEARWQQLLKVRDAVRKALELARNAGVIRDSLEASVTLFADERQLDLLKEKFSMLAEVFIVSEVVLEPIAEAPAELRGIVALDDVPGVRVRVDRIEGEKCPRCWRYAKEVRTDELNPVLCKRCEQVLAIISST